MANECLHSRHKERKPGLICKLDFENAHDRVKREFFLYVLRHMCFGVKWSEWFQACVSSACFSILINRSPKGFFQQQRGLRQGDPLSPFLSEEALSRMLEVASSANLFRGFEPTRCAPTVNTIKICG